MPHGLRELWSRLVILINSWYFYASLLVLLVVIFGATVVICKWEWLRALNDIEESNSSTLRNVALIFAGFIALAFAAWRAKIADSQSRTAQRQADTAQSGHLNERYQKGAEMLGSDILATRMGGIYALQRLAEERPTEYHVQVMRLLCAFARHPPGEDIESGSVVREDVQSVMYAIRACRKNRFVFGLEAADDFRLSLTKAHLREAVLSEIDLSRADLIQADLSRAHLREAVLSGAYLIGANLAGATLSNADMTGANLSGAALTTDSLAGETPLAGLTQEQLDSACADSDNLPILQAFDDADSKPLVWYQRPCQPHDCIRNKKLAD